MRDAVAVLSLIMLACTLLFGSPVHATEEGRPAQDFRRQVFQEWARIANGRTEFEVSDLASLPKRIVLLLNESGCRYEEDIKAIPVRFINQPKRRFAVVFCRFTVLGAHQVFDLSDLQKPRPVEFPVPALRADGFGTTRSPGILTWSAGADVFWADSTSDICPSPTVRYSYRPGELGAPVAFIITRVELRQNGCNRDSDWVAIWEAPKWSLSAMPSAQ